MAKRKASSSSSATEVVKKKITSPKAKSTKAKGKAPKSDGGASSSKRSSSRRTSTKKRRVQEDSYLNDLETTLDDDEILRLQEKGELEDSDLEEELFAEEVTAEEAEAEARRAARRAPVPVQAREDVVDQDCCLIGDPIPLETAVQRWPRRYDRKGKGVIMRPEDAEMLVQAKRHYLKAQVDGTVFDLDDNAHVSSEEEAPPYIAKIIELFEDLDGNPYFRAQWYYRAEDTVIETVYPMREGKRIFLSEVQDDNPLGCLLKKLNIIRIKPNLDIDAKLASISKCDYYFDMKYLVPFSTFIVPPEDPIVAGDSHSDLSSDEEVSKTENNEVVETKRPEMTLLDLYSGCGAMSTGLCLGAKVHNTNLVTKWAVDFNSFACKSLQLNHPETKVRNETVEDFLTLLKEWKRICASYSLIESDETHPIIDEMKADYEDSAEDDEEEQEEEEINDQEVFEVESVIGICYGDPKENKKVGLYFKVSWKGYDARYDTWEPIQGLSNCYKAIGEFVRNGFKEKIVPMPGDADVVCGGPPCQGLSGYNRYRNKEKPLEDTKNKQLIVFMEVVDFLKPKFVLMENVVDLLKFALGYCGRYAVGRLVDMNYQTRMGMMAAGGYGLPQFRMRVFLWGALPTECLPQFPLPTHDAVQRGNIPRAFEMNTVAYSADQKVQLRDKLFLGDAISDLPAVANDERRDVMPYSCEPQTDFQRFIRLARDAASGSGSELLTTLFDHRPLHLNADDFQRVCQIPKKKGANFRNLPGLIVNEDKNKVELDPNFKRLYLDSGKPLVPDYAITYVRGTSLKPFGRLWYDETVGTVVTRAEPHNQIICHPYLDRVLTIRENARLQGFPDYYQLIGPIKQRYIQVGNAVAVPVARALGYSLALANEGGITQEHVFVLPPGFPEQQVIAAPPSVEMEED